ncbi:protein SHOOT GRAVITROPISM 6 isoform X2 [Cryptomeria japonica]|uniref:protein SHOOT GRAVITROPISM 6 isoform X2 n=1 Tax=Cryptomeria japonica TaxID=3369 RepID=UPI0027DAB07D|nr:protein SHOOT GRAVITROPISM 6 isoform X2 [Cryptomeria japonica]
MSLHAQASNGDPGVGRSSKDKGDLLQSSIDKDDLLRSNIIRNNLFQSSVPRREVIQVLVGALGDESAMVRKAAMNALQENAPFNSIAILDCCTAVFRVGGRKFMELQRFGQGGSHITGVFQIMAFTVRVMNEEEIDMALMTKLVKVASSEMTVSKDLDTDWQRAASSLLVAIGTRLPDLMIEEVFLHLAGSAIAISAMVQTLAEFASAEALKFTPHLKDVLSRVLPVLGNIKDAQRSIFANAIKCWCQAAWQYRLDVPSAPEFDHDVLAFLHSAFDLLLRVWANSRELKVRLSTIEALGNMVGLINRAQLKAALPRFLPAILGLYKKVENAYVVTCSLHSLLEASLMSDSGPPLLDFEELIVVVNSLLPLASTNGNNTNCSEFGWALKNYNEILRCFLTIGMLYHDDIFDFLMSKINSKEDLFKLGALCVLKHLLPRLSEAWYERRLVLIEAVKSLLDEQDLSVRKSLAEASNGDLIKKNQAGSRTVFARTVFARTIKPGQGRPLPNPAFQGKLIVVMASHCYVEGTCGELFVEFLVLQCAIAEEEVTQYRNQHEAFESTMGLHIFHATKTELRMGAVSPAELRTVSEKGLLLLTITIPEMEVILWPFLLKMIIPSNYTAAVATICRCISELARHRTAYGNPLLNEIKSHTDLPTAEEVFARLVVLLHNPLARDQLAARILTVLYYLAPLFPKNVILFWEDEIPKMKAYITDTEDSKGIDDSKDETLQQETWDDMIINFFSESLDVIRDPKWTSSLGNSLCRQYVLYNGDDEHSALLHRCLGMLLQKVDNRAYVREKLDWMYRKANIADKTNRIGLAKGVGLVAATHLDTVLEKLKNILDIEARSIFQRFFSLFMDSSNKPDLDDIHAALALMYGYTASYAPSTVIEARIDALVGTNMLSRLLHVRKAEAKQAVITAIDLLGRAVIKAAESGASFPLKRRDQMLDYTLTLMAGDGSENLTDSNLELLHTQTLALNTCTTLVSVEPKLIFETRNHILKATLGFFTLPNDPPDVVDPLINNLITLLCAILLTSGEDGKSRADQLQHILKSIDQYVSSPIDHQRKRGCVTVHKLLMKFRCLCSSGHCGFGCLGTCIHVRHSTDIVGQRIPSAFFLPSRESLNLGERVMAYLPRCADANSEIQKISAKILDLLFIISLSLPRPVGSTVDEDREISYIALTALEDVISIYNRDAMIDQSDAFHRIVSSVCILLTKEELVAALHGCVAAICDKVKQSAEGTVEAIIEFILKRGRELNETDVSRITQSLLSATVAITDKHLRHEVLNATCCLAEHTSAKIVFSELLSAAERDVMTKDITRLRGGWPIQDAFYAFSQHDVLSMMFLDHIIDVLNQVPYYKEDIEKIEYTDQITMPSVVSGMPQAATLALSTLFRSGGRISKKSVERRYAAVFCALALHFGSCHGLAIIGVYQPLRTLLHTFQAFCECIGDQEMGKVLAKDGEHLLGSEKWTETIGVLSKCVATKRPKEVEIICKLLWQSMNRSQRFQNEAAAAVLTEYVRSSEIPDSLLDQLVGVLSSYIGNESPTVRRLCVSGLVKIPSSVMIQYSSQVLSVIVALLEDPGEEVAYAAVQGLISVLELAHEDAVAPVLLNLCVRLRSLQVRLNSNMRCASFSAMGALSKFGVGAQREAFLEQVHSSLPRLIFHVQDEETIVRQACKNTLRQILPLLDIENMISLVNSRAFNSDHRSDYEDIVRDFTKNLCEHFTDRTDTYMASAIQAFETTWPIIQANAAYFAGCMLSQLSDRRLLPPYLTQVVGILVVKSARSPDAVVRATAASALSLLLENIH